MILFEAQEWAQFGTILAHVWHRQVFFSTTCCTFLQVKLSFTRLISKSMEEEKIWVPKKVWKAAFDPSSRQSHPFSHAWTLVPLQREGYENRPNLIFTAIRH